METILIGEKETKEYVEEAKAKLAEGNEVELKAFSRDTVKAVDAAEILKIDGFKTKNIKIETEEKEGKRISLIKIEMEK